MSDFGAIIYIRKKNDEDFNEEEVKALAEINKKLKEENDLHSSMGVLYSFDLGTTRNTDGNIRGVNILLSDYWGDTSDYKWHGKVDKKDTTVIARKVRALLDAKKYSVKGSFEWW